jgi:hypothetical protein
MLIATARSTLLGLLTTAILSMIISMSMPSASSASSVDTRFLTSSTGTSSIGIGDTIQFEVSVTADIGRQYSTLFWTLSGDADSVIDPLTPANGWPGVANNVLGWEWNYAPGTRNVNFSTASRNTPANYTQIGVNQANPIPAPGIIGLGYFAQPSTGSGIPSLVGTVTIAANTTGQFQGGAFYVAGLDGFFDAGSGSEDLGATYNSAIYLVNVPEPGTAQLIALGMLALATGRMRTKNR